MISSAKTVKVVLSAFAQNGVGVVKLVCRDGFLEAVGEVIVPYEME